jgi:V8-like Glu-specific endopeptidase
MKSLIQPATLLMLLAASPAHVIAAQQNGSSQAPASDTPMTISDQPMPKLSGETELVADSATAKFWCTPEPRDFLDNEVRWFKAKSHLSPVSWLKVHLTIDSNDSKDGWSVIVRDQGGAQTDLLTGSDFQIVTSDPQSHEALLEAITQRVPGNTFRVELHSTAVPAKIRLCVRSYEYESDTSHIEVKEVTHKKDLRTFVQKTDANYNLGRPIAAIYFPSRSTKKEISCTGFPITDTLFVTNYHCISETWQLRTAFVKFNFEVDPADHEFERKFTMLAMPPNPALDFTVLRLDAPVPTMYIAKVQPEPLNMNEQLVLFQHPDGLRKKVANSGCQVDVVDGAGQTQSHTDFYHSCDSSGGSSGSPVMDPTNGMVIGLHHIGTYDPDSKSYHNLALKIQLLVNNLSLDILHELQQFSPVSVIAGPQQ